MRDPLLSLAHRWSAATGHGKILTAPNDWRRWAFEQAVYSRVRLAAEATGDRWRVRATGWRKSATSTHRREEVATLHAMTLVAEQRDPAEAPDVADIREHKAVLDVTTDQLAPMYLGGMTIPQIAAEVGVSESTVYRRLCAAGIQRRRGKRKPAPEHKAPTGWVAHILRKAHAVLDGDGTMAAASARCEMPERTIRRWLKEYHPSTYLNDA